MTVSTSVKTKYQKLVDDLNNESASFNALRAAFQGDDPKAVLNEIIARGFTLQDVKELSGDETYLRSAGTSEQVMLRFWFL